MVRHLIFTVTFISTASHAVEVCDSTKSKCTQVGSSAAWLLSIIETSIEPCKNNTEIGGWLANNSWLIAKVKAAESEYDDLIRAQHKFWNTANVDISNQCSKLVKLIKSGSPLNSELR